MQKAKILTQGEQPSASEVSDGLDTLNDMLSSWANETLLAYVRLIENFPWAAGTVSKTIGTGGDIDTVCPVYISSAYFRLPGSDIDYPLTILTDSGYDLNEIDKSIPGVPDRLQFQRSAPLGLLTLSPVPNPGGTIFIRSEKPALTLSLDTDLEFPAGWQHALIFNLAMLLAPEYGVDAPTGVVAEARSSKTALKTAVARNRNMDVPPLTSGRCY